MWEFWVKTLNFLLHKYYTIFFKKVNRNFYENVFKNFFEKIIDKIKNLWYNKRGMFFFFFLEVGLLRLSGRFYCVGSALLRKGEVLLRCCVYLIVVPTD